MFQGLAPNTAEEDCNQQVGRFVPRFAQDKLPNINPSLCRRDANSNWDLDYLNDLFMSRALEQEFHPRAAEHRERIHVNSARSNKRQSNLSNSKNKMNIQLLQPNEKPLINIFGQPVSETEIDRIVVTQTSSLLDKCLVLKLEEDLEELKDGQKSVLEPCDNHRIIQSGTEESDVDFIDLEEPDFHLSDSKGYDMDFSNDGGVIKFKNTHSIIKK